MRKNGNEVWEFLEDITWDSLVEKPNALTSANKGGIHNIDSSIVA